MSKSQFFLLAALAGLAAASCSKSSSSSPAALAPVTVTVGNYVTSMDPMDTKVMNITDAGSPVKSVTLAFFDASGNEVFKQTQTKADATEEAPFGVFSCQLHVGTHTMVVVGRGPGNDEEFELISPTSAGYTSDLVRETFSAEKSVTVTSAGPNNFTATLDRVVAKLFILSTDGKLPEAQTVRITMSKGGKYFNPSTGLATTNTGYVREVSAGNNNYQYSASLTFLFLGTDELTMDITLEVLDANSQVITTHTLQDVPFKRNCATNLSGPLFSADASASAFLVNDLWGTPSNIEF